MSILKTKKFWKKRKFHWFKISQWSMKMSRCFLGRIFHLKNVLIETYWFENHTIKSELDSLHLNLENLVQLSQDFQKVVIFEFSKIYNTRKNVQ